ncbi:hypothetical protein P4O66_013471, partial [Electrophorus voltai]
MCFEAAVTVEVQRLPSQMLPWPPKQLRGRNKFTKSSSMSFVSPVLQKHTGGEEGDEEEKKGFVALESKRADEPVKCSCLKIRVWRLMSMRVNPDLKEPEGAPGG